MTEKIAFEDVNPTSKIKKIFEFNWFGYLRDRVANFRCNFLIHFCMEP